MASNRGPVTFIEENGALVPRRGAGGLVTALTDALAASGGRWVAAAMTDLDRRRSEEAPDGRLDVVVDDLKLQIRMLAFAPDTYERFYNTVSNRLLWFLHHYLWDIARWPRFGAESRRSWAAFREVNRSFAEALADEAGDREADVLVQDYHLSTVPAELRVLAPKARIAHFHHCPFAGPDYLRLVPSWIRTELLEGLLGADLLGFQTRAWAESFLFGCRHLDGARVDPRRRLVTWQGRKVRAGVFPISIDAVALQELASSPAVKKKQRQLSDWLGERRLLFRADRAELSKNVLRGFLAYEEFLDRYPKWRGKVVFLAHLQPSRRALPEYQTYTNECLRAVERINEKLGGGDWRPIEVDLVDDYEKVLAAHQLYDVLLVNPVFDGMNLVAKEGALLNRNGGVLLLSKTAGAFAELGRGVVPLDPLDVGGTAEAIEYALAMPAEERARRTRVLRREAARTTPAEWVERQLAALSVT
ncbi:MAG: alpha,alpha-trehalose-phosphate synthase (UDP-forming) [Actinomycetota bacterium]